MLYSGVNNFRKISNDIVVKKEYEKISKKESENAGEYATHDIGHVLRVVDFCEKISRLLSLSDNIIDEIKVAALLHDIGIALDGKDGHAERSYRWAKKYFSNVNLDEETKNRILEAIRHHSDGTNTVHSRILTFADKLDVNKHRILPNGLLLDGNRQYANIEEVAMDISDNVLIINFISNKKINFDELNEYYFTAKIFSAIENLASHFNLQHEVFMDNKKWEARKND